MGTNAGRTAKPWQHGNTPTTPRLSLLRCAVPSDTPASAPLNSTPSTGPTRREEYQSAQFQTTPTHNSTHGTSHHVTSRHVTTRLNEDLSRSSRRSACLSLFCRLPFPPPLPTPGRVRASRSQPSPPDPHKKVCRRHFYFFGPGKFSLLFPSCPPTEPSPAARPAAALNPKSCWTRAMPPSSAPCSRELGLCRRGETERARLRL